MDYTAKQYECVSAVKTLILGSGFAVGFHPKVQLNSVSAPNSVHLDKCYKKSNPGYYKFAEMLITVWILISYLTAHSAAKPISLDNGSVADETAHDRQKRWNILRNTYYSRTWPTNRPITLSVLNSPEGCSRQDVEDILLECARVGLQQLYISVDNCCNACEAIM